MTDIEYVRIKDPVSGAEFTYDTAKVQALGLENHVIDKDPLGPNGLPAPAKPRLPLGEGLAGSGGSGEAPGETVTEPPRSGRGSGVEAWTAYATRLELEVLDGATRDEVIALVDARNQEQASPPAPTETTGATSPGGDAGQTSATPPKEN